MGLIPEMKAGSTFLNQGNLTYQQREKNHMTVSMNAKNKNKE